jgi:LPS export ABC transporter protein LptC
MTDIPALKLRWVILTILATLFFGACNSDDKYTQVDRKARNIPDQESWETTYEISKNGVPRAIIWAGYTAKFNKLSEIHFSDSVHIDFYDEFGNHDSELFSDSGLVYEKNKNIVASGNVVLISDSGFVLETEKLHWNNTDQRIYSTIETIIMTDKDTLIGDAFESDPSIKNYQIINPRGISYRQKQ